MVLPRKRWFWSQKPTFASQKDGFPEAVQTKTIFLRGKSWFFYEEPSFYEAKPKKPSFSTSPPHSLRKIVFLVFWFCLVKDGFGAKNQLLPRKKMVFLRQSRPKSSFYVGKVGFFMKNYLFTRQNQKTIFFNIPSPFSKKDVFLFFWSRASRRPVLWAVWGLFFRETATESSKKWHRARAGFFTVFTRETDLGGSWGGSVSIYIYIYTHFNMATKNVWKLYMLTVLFVVVCEFSKFRMPELNATCCPYLHGVLCPITPLNGPFCRVVCGSCRAESPILVEA